MKNPELLTWMKAQADYARQTLDAIPVRQQIMDQNLELDATTTEKVSNVDRRSGDQYFYLKQRPTETSPKLIRPAGTNWHQEAAGRPGFAQRGGHQSRVHHLLQRFAGWRSGRRRRGCRRVREYGHSHPEYGDRHGIGQNHRPGHVRWRIVASSSFELPNLITIGAVDTQGKKANFTTFTTFGRTVAVYALGTSGMVTAPVGGWRC